MYLSIHYYIFLKGTGYVYDVKHNYQLTELHSPIAKLLTTLGSDSYGIHMNLIIFRVSFELEPGAVGQTTDFKESNKRLEWNLKKVMLVISIQVFIAFYYSVCQAFGYNSRNQFSSA